MIRKTLIAGGLSAAVLAGALPLTTAASTITVTSWGGAYSMSQRKAYYEPFMKETGNVVLEDEWDGSVSMIRAMVETGNYKSHVIDIPPGHMLAACDEGVLEPIEWDKIGVTMDDFLPGGAHECAVGTIAWSTVYAYNTQVFPDNGPVTWADFWDVEKFPGKRGLYKADPVFHLEFALLAEGVPTDKIYEVLDSPGGIDRAFDKLLELKPNAIFWETGAQAPQLLADKEVSMTTGWNGRFYNAMVEDNAPFKIVWWGQGLDYDFWVVPKGHPEKELAWEFIRFASTPERQGDQTNYISYGPLRKGADKFVNPNILPDLPTSPANQKVWFKVDSEWWADHLEELKQRYATALAK